MDDRDQQGGGEARTRDDEDLVVQEQVTVSRRRARQLDRQAAWAAHNWGWLLGLGIVSVVLGIIIASHAFGGLRALIWLSGLFLLFFGIAQLMTVGKGGDRRTHLVAGLVTIVGGIVLLVWPGQTVKVAAVVAGLTVLVWGLVRGFTSWRDSHSLRGHDLVVSVAMVVLGLVMIVWPSATITLVGVFIGVAAIVWGLVTIASAFHLRAVGRRWERLHERARPAG
jgi:uncharacterized membrane protein HdeD (DUF308 family)